MVCEEQLGARSWRDGRQRKQRSNNDRTCFGCKSQLIIRGKQTEATKADSMLHVSRF